MSIYNVVVYKKSKICWMEYIHEFFEAFITQKSNTTNITASVWKFMFANENNTTPTVKKFMFPYVDKQYHCYC